MNSVIETLVETASEIDSAGLPDVSGQIDKTGQDHPPKEAAKESVDPEITARMEALLEACKPGGSPSERLWEVDVSDAGKRYGNWSIEAATVAAMLREEKCLKQAIEKLTMEDWSEEINARLFATMLGLFNAGQKITEKSVCSTYGIRFPKKSPSVLASHLTACCRSGCNPEDFGTYVKMLKLATQIRTRGYYSATDYVEQLTVELLRARLPQVIAVNDTWFQYANGIWSSNDKNVVRNIAANCIHPSNRSSTRVASLMNHLEDLFQVREGELSGGYKFDQQDHVVVNANNVVLLIDPVGGVRTIDHSPDYKFVAKLDAAYDKQATSPLFLKTLSEALPDEDDRELYQIFCGSILYPSCKFEIALVNYGPGGTSKSTLAGAIRDTLGDALTGAVGLETLCKSGSYSLPTLKFKMLNLGSELNGNEVDESSNFKALVSGEYLNTRQIYEAPTEMRTTCKLWYLSNSMPRFRNGSDAELRRLRILHFAQLPKIKDPELKAKLRGEISGILNWMLEGLLKLLPLGEFPSGGRTAQMIREGFGRNNDPIGSFVTSRCNLDPGVKILKQELFRAFMEWCDEQGASFSASQSIFYKRLREKFPKLEYSRLTVGDNREYFTLGLELRRSASDSAGESSFSLENMKKNMAAILAQRNSPTPDQAVPSPLEG